MSILWSKMFMDSYSDDTIEIGLSTGASSWVIFKIVDNNRVAIVQINEKQAKEVIKILQKCIKAAEKSKKMLKEGATIVAIY